jgi:golgi pH regulator
MASLIFVGILVFTQTRGFLLTILKVFRAWSSIVSSNSVVLWLAHLMGMYFVSSFVLMRMNLNPTHRLVLCN